jgi:histidine triad (HIT) family protein
MKDCIFCKIRDRQIPKEFDFEDEDIMVFPDINPLKPIHMLIVPKKHIVEFVDLDDKELFFKIKKIIDKVIKDKNLTKRGYRVSANGGGAQAIDHLHFHVTGPISDMEV